MSVQRLQTDMLQRHGLIRSHSRMDGYACYAALCHALLRFAIICLVIILKLSPQDIVLHINVKSEIIPIVVACGT